MGSFNAVCIISNLAIEAGTPVRFLALTESEYHRGNEHACYVTGRWQPRTAPLRAIYNDYGSVEEIQPGLVEQVFFKSFEEDAIWKGVGDNQCHDVEVRKGMSQEKWLEALWEGRVYASSRFSKAAAYRANPPKEHEEHNKKYEREKGIPTLDRIEEVLRKLPAAFGDEGYLIDEVAYGFVRVRVGGYGDKSDKLAAALPVLQEAGYAAMITCGTGSYSDAGEILVAPKPGDKIHIGKGLATEEQEEWGSVGRPISQAMIREDVWQILLKTSFKHWNGKTLTVDSFKQEARGVVAEELEFRRKIEAEQDPATKASLVMLHYFKEDYDRETMFKPMLKGSEGVSGFYFKQAFKLATELAASEEELVAFAEDLAEMLFVQMVYANNLHGQWHPTTNGGQDGSWKEHREFLAQLALIKGRWEEDEDEEDSDDEEDESEDQDHEKA